jgi:hypothetical protein
MHDFLQRSALLSAAAAALALGEPVQAQESNACPVDGCEVAIVSATPEGDELALVFEANFLPDMSKNHIHVWWGENFTVRQVSNNAEPTYGVKQGDWHPTADYPNYVTTGGASTELRGDAVTLCVSAADRNHDILDPEKVACYDAASLLQ